VADEVIRAIEIIETREGREASIVVERAESPSGEFVVYGDGLSSNTRDQGRGNGDFYKLGEHFE